MRVFVGRDDDGEPVQMSRMVRGGKKDAERVASQLQLTPARNAGRKTVAALLDALQDLRRDTWAPYTRRDVASRAQRISEVGSGSCRSPGSR